MARRVARTLLGGVCLATLALAPTGCAGVRVYSDPGLQHETGLKVFTPKPYLLVTRTGAKEKPLEISIVYLPDTADVRYVKQQRGWGSNDLSLKFQNGLLTEFGTKTDSKIPESLEAAASLLTAAGGVFKTALDNPAPTGGERTFELYEIVQEQGRTRLVRVDIR